MSCLQVRNYCVGQDQRENVPSTSVGDAACGQCYAVEDRSYDGLVWLDCYFDEWMIHTITREKTTGRVFVSRTAQAVMPMTMTALTHCTMWAIVETVPQGCS